MSSKKQGKKDAGSKFADGDQPARKGYTDRTQGVAMNAAMGIDRQSFAETWRAVFNAAVSQPRALLESGAQLQRDLTEVVLGNSSLVPDPKDGRFHDEAWADNPVYRRLGQAYLAWARSLDHWLANSGMTGMDESRARFVLDATKEVLAPMNILPGNPGAVRQLAKSRGQSLINGVRNFIDDQRHNYGYPAVADRDSFIIGKDVAASEGAVVFRNELFELMQYLPLTETVQAEPLLYVFSQVNRFYLGDLTPDRSLFQGLMEKNIPVFAISWRNPTAAQRDWNLGTYAEGVIEAVAIMREITGASKVNLMGVCAGGLTAAVAAGVLRKREQDWINSLSLFINVLDQRPDDSDFGLFVSARSIAAQKERVRAKGMYDEKDVFEMFALLRWEENIMSFLRRNYLMGEAPLQHPLLFWSMDYTRVPAGLHTDFLDLSLDNKLAKKEFKALGKRVNLSKIKYPVYMMAGSTDHITPWKACYRSTQLFGGDMRFVLTNQNHTQTICARTDNKHLKYWVAPELPPTADAWADIAEETAGSWTHDWIAWLHERSPDQVPARSEFGSTDYPVIDSAPGRYVIE